MIHCMRIDCRMNSLRQQTHDKTHGLCNCSNANIKSENDQTLSQFALDENKVVQKRAVKLAKSVHTENQNIMAKVHD